MVDDFKNREIRLEREKLLFLFSTALEKGDNETVFELLQKAQDDQLLLHEMNEIREVYYEEAMQQLAAGEESLVAELAVKYIPSGQLNEEILELRPLTVEDVLAKLQTESARDAILSRAFNELLSQITPEIRQLPLPNNLNQASIKFLFRQHQLNTSDYLLKKFRETAIFISMGQEQSMAELMAARKQRRIRTKRPEGQENG